MRQKNIKSVIREYFFLYPSAKLRVRELERKLSLPLPSVIRYCKELEKEGLLIREHVGNVGFYTSSGSETFLLEKKLYNINQLYKSGIISFLKTELSNPALVLFGSYAKGEDTEDSDIDIYIESSSKKDLNLEKYEKFLKREIQLFWYKSTMKISNPHLANNIINGITLNSYIEVFK